MRRQDQRPDKFVNLLPHEILQKVSDSGSVKERVKILQEYPSFALKTILQVNFRDDITFDFPDGAPPYREDLGVAGKQTQSIEKAIRRLSNCVAQNTKVSKLKKEKIFIGLLETVHPEDAKLIIAMKDKNIKSLYNGVTVSTVSKAYPDLKLTVE